MHESGVCLSYAWILWRKLALKVIMMQSTIVIVSIDASRINSPFVVLFIEHLGFDRTLNYIQDCCIAMRINIVNHYTYECMYQFLDIFQNKVIVHMTFKMWLVFNLLLQLIQIASIHFTSVCHQFLYPTVFCCIMPPVSTKMQSNWSCQIVEFWLQG